MKTEEETADTLYSVKRQPKQHPFYIPSNEKAIITKLNKRYKEALERQEEKIIMIKVIAATRTFCYESYKNYVFFIGNKRL